MTNSQIPNNHLWTERRSGSSEDISQDTLPLRTPYEKDRGRLLHSACFRRLQSKTQVFNMHEHDFARTRLTHSLEVMQIATGITRVLRAKYDLDGKNYELIKSSLVENPFLDATVEFKQLVQTYLPSDALIESICLAHDIGHPPFGHSGEYVLNKIMHAHGNFEGNAQSLRCVARLENFNSGVGLDLTRRCLLGILKYPTLINLTQPEIKPSAAKYIRSYAPGKGIYLEDTDIFNWILAPFSEGDRKEFTKLRTKLTHENKEIQVTCYKSFDCSIMELADDIAYSIHDIEDALKFKTITQQNWFDFFQTLSPQDQQAFTTLSSEEHFGYDFIDRMFNGNSEARKKVCSALIQLFITHVDVELQHKFDDPIIDLKANVPRFIKSIMFAFKNFSASYILHSRDIRGYNNRGQHMIEKLFEDMFLEPTLMGRKKYLKFKEIKDETVRMRFVCDYIAMMTNDSLTRFYKEYIG